ncbi:MAG: response regulator transcription factor [Burkholderiales bacterium]|nr:response regulator transcription factor [Burkholderiales bacterium]
MTSPSPQLLIVEDDAALRSVLARAMERRGFAVRVAGDAEQALVIAHAQTPTHAIVDLRLPGASGLTVVPALRALDDAMRIVVLTGYASIATAVEAIKLGATHYLAKPVDADQIVAAFGETAGNADAAVSQKPLSVDRLEWEHIQKILGEHDGNISATARSLGMHRRTLQRKLAKRAPGE